MPTLTLEGTNKKIDSEMLKKMNVNFGGEKSSKKKVQKTP